MDLKYGLNKVGLPLIVTSNKPNLCFLIDTGATHNLIFSFVIEALGDYNITGEGDIISGIDGVEHSTKRLSYTLLFEDEDKIIPVDFNVIEATEIVSRMQKESGIQIHGILGIPFLSENKCVIDFEHNCITTSSLHPKYRASVREFFNKVYSRLQEDARLGRWMGISPECFVLREGDETAYIYLEYEIKDIGTFDISLTAYLPDHYNGDGISMDIMFLKTQIPKPIMLLLIEALQTLDAQLVADYPKLEKGMVNPFEYVMYSTGNYIDNEPNAYEAFAKLLDVFVSKIGKFKLYPVEPEPKGTEYSDELKAFFAEIEHLLGPYDIVEEMEECNDRIEKGHFKIATSDSQRMCSHFL